MDYSHKPCNIIDNYKSPYVYILGDFNANVLRINSVFANELNKMCIRKSPVDSFNYVIKAHGTVSWLDHCLTTHTGYENVTNIEVYKDCVTDSHLPLFVTVDCNVNVFTKLSNDNTLKFY